MNTTFYQFAGDEAGDVSFRFERGATRHFVVALIGTREPNRLRQALDAVRSQCYLPAGFEFKFRRLGNRRLRERLWDALKPLDFHAWAVVAHKQQLPDTIRIMPPRTFYVYFVSEAIRLIPEALREGSPLWLDEFDRSGKTIAELKRAFGRRGLRYRFRRIRAVRSHSEDLVQVADVVAGAILRHYSRGESEGYRHLANKIVTISEYPRQ
jgi:hypothetical protein